MNNNYANPNYFESVSASQSVHEKMEVDLPIDNVLNEEKKDINVEFNIKISKPVLQTNGNVSICL